MKHLLLLAASLTVSALSAADPPARTFEVQCAACHAVDRMLVGPSLVEISGIYRENPDGFVKWCIAPQHKREGVIEMPSMAHLGEPVLRELHGYILTAAAGKTELKKGEGDPFTVSRAMVRRPQVQRIFLPDASPAAIAVALPGDLSYCFDAAECRLRYVWKGGFIDGFTYWKGNGSSLAKLDGEVVYREPKFPILPAGASTSRPIPPEFLGYKVSKDGLPTFRYSQRGVIWSETIKPLPDGLGIQRHFESEGGQPVYIETAGGVSCEGMRGIVENGLFLPDPAQPLILTHRWK